jgi:hypothetical protein
MMDHASIPSRGNNAPSRYQLQTQMGHVQYPPLFIRKISVKKLLNFWYPPVPSLEPMTSQIVGPALALLHYYVVWLAQHRPTLRMEPMTSQLWVQL